MLRRFADAVRYRGAPGRLEGRFGVVAGVRAYERGGAPVVVLVHGVGVSS
ncbi:MAG: hypothetical protein ICV64_12280, partial [Thermoleophilia bacterium]|nr:hypothetical protein [Thermoleophilia bacterium]